jgi:hypothetical protein
MYHAWERSEYCVLVGKAEGKRPLRRSRHRWEDNKCDMMPKSQNLGIRKMFKRCPLLGKVEHKSQTPTNAHNKQSLTAMYIHHGSGTVGGKRFLINPQ